MRNQGNRRAVGGIVSYCSVDNIINSICRSIKYK